MVIFEVHYNYPKLQSFTFSRGSIRVLVVVKYMEDQDPQNMNIVLSQALINRVLSFHLGTYEMEVYVGMSRRKLNSGHKFQMFGLGNMWKIVCRR